MHLATRKLRVPPDDLKAALEGLVRTGDFEEL